LSEPASPRERASALALARRFQLGAGPRIALLGLLGLALASGQEVFARLAPALVYAALGVAFAASLAREDSLVERLARMRIPELPEFVRGYCRRLTGLWALLLLGVGLALAALAVLGPPEVWRAASGWGALALLGAVAAGEFAFRKWWFRYYFSNGPVDRLFARLFPAEATARGRRSLEAFRLASEENARAAAAGPREVRTSSSGRPRG
jgi:uncharacterized membrane protein